MLLHLNLTSSGNYYYEYEIEMLSIQKRKYFLIKLKLNIIPVITTDHSNQLLWTVYYFVCTPESEYRDLINHFDNYGHFYMFSFIIFE